VKMVCEKEWLMTQNKKRNKKHNLLIPEKWSCKDKIIK